jgi:hypothetical protein
MPAAPDNTGREGEVLVDLPLHLFPPRGANIFDVFTDPVSVGPLATATLFTRKIGVGDNVRIEAIGFDSNDPTALTNATFQFKTNGNPIEGYGQLSVAIGTFDDPGAVRVVIPGQRTLTVDVTNNSPGSTWTYQLRIQGWSWSPQAAR